MLLRALLTLPGAVGAVALGAAAFALLAWGLGKLVAWAIAGRERGRLGRASDRVAAVDAGRVVTLRGTVEATGAPGRRFDDGGEAAAGSALARGSSVEAGARAETLRLRVGGVAVRLEGPVRVVVGSRHAAAGGWLRRLGEPVLARLGEADIGAEWRLRQRPARVRFRSLSAGDRVRAQGVLQRAGAAGEDDRLGYRDAAAAFALAPASPAQGAASVLPAAFEGTPASPATRWAAAGGAASGALIAVLGLVALRMAPPPAPLQAIADAISPPPYHHQWMYLPASRWLEQGDYASASGTLPQPTWFHAYDIQVHLLAGHLDRAAAIARQRTKDWHPSSRRARCFVDALDARGPDAGAGAALARLRAAAPSSRACALLLSDFAARAERAMILRALPHPARAGHWGARIRSLLELEAGLAPSEIPEDLQMPHPGGLIDRGAYWFSGHVPAVLLAEAIERSPRAAVDRRWAALEAANAAFVLSGVGEPDRARRAWERADRDRALVDTVALRALRVAIELRAGDLAAAQRFAANLPPDDPMALRVALLEGIRLDPELVAKHYDVRALGEVLTVGDRLPEYLHDLMRPGAHGDGERLFLLAPRVEKGRDELLAWARTGNPDRDRHDGKGPTAPSSPLDLLARLEERRQIAAALGEARLAADLDGALHRGREALLRRDVAVLMLMADGLLWETD